MAPIPYIRSTALAVARTVGGYTGETAQTTANFITAGKLVRDLKPSNIILIEKAGEPEVVKLLDFGIARVVQEVRRDGPKVTQTGDEAAEIE